MKFQSLLLVAALLGACSAKTETTKTPATPKPVAEVSAAIAAKLEKADAADGKADKVVHKCAGCSLHMDGKTEHAVAVGSYTLHFCDHCEDKVADPLPVVEKLEN
ncbi:MAG: hypothetical protein K8J09_01040 [Planctomycetes bacterium]|nr:hypothetical protein [Planctomycetota bacterium]MCC7397835.1 hypothetical protein [Planctomycetota bacterium]